MAASNKTMRMSVGIIKVKTDFDNVDGVDDDVISENDKKKTMTKINMCLFL